MIWAACCFAVWLELGLSAQVGCELYATEQAATAAGHAARMLPVALAAPPTLPAELECIVGPIETGRHRPEFEV